MYHLVMTHIAMERSTHFQLVNLYTMAMWVITRGYYQHFSMKNPCHGDNLCPYFLGQPSRIPRFRRPVGDYHIDVPDTKVLGASIWRSGHAISSVLYIHVSTVFCTHTHIYIYTNNKNNTDNGNNTSIDYDDDDSRASQFQETTSLGAPHPQIDMAAELHTLKTGKPPVPLFVRTEMITMISLQGTTSVGSCVGSETMYFPSQDMDRPCFLFWIIENQAFLTRSCAFSLWLLVHSVGADWLLCWLHWHFLPIFQLWSHAFKCLDPFFRHTKKLSSSKTSSLLPNCPVHSPPWRVPSLLSSSNHWFWFPPL